MNIRQVKQKIKSVSNVKKITKAMEMVSAVKMKKAQQAAFDGKSYQDSLDLMIKDLTIKINPNFSTLLIKTPATEIKRELSIVIASNKGLCGSFNFNLFRYFIKNSMIDNSDFIILGKKASYFINKIGGKIIADFSTGTFTDHVSAIFQLVLDGYLQNKYQRVAIYFNQFISALNSQPIKEVILPVDYDQKDKITQSINQEYLIEPSPETVIDSLLRSWVEQKIRRAMIEAEAGEHSARMISMKQATDNASDVVYNLTMLRNKIRQEKITNELLDMMTAKESVESE